MLLSLSGNQHAETSLTHGKWQYLSFTVKRTTLSIYADVVLQYNGVTKNVNYDTLLLLEEIVIIAGELDDIKNI